MIDIKTKIHDALSLEFKVAFKHRTSNKDGDSTVDMWVFIPDSLDVNRSTYSSQDFYRDLRTNVRLVTPSYRLDEIADGPAEPRKMVLEASTPEDQEYALKLFCAIVKSSLRDSRDITGGRYVECVRNILDCYRSFAPSKCHKLCGEFLCSVCAQNAFKRIDNGESKELLDPLLRYISDYRSEAGYMNVIPDGGDANDHYLYRHGVLKKYVERPFYLRAPKKRDGVLVEQAYYSIAAGLAMLFATVVAWAFQRRFGNLTWPLFIALIISYMMKDRIKELMRFYFAHRAGARFFDRKAKIIFRDAVIGSLRERMDFVSFDKVPEDIMDIRNRRRHFDDDVRATDEKVFLYRKVVDVDRDINDIIRLNVSNYLRKMDNPVKNVRVLDEDGNIVEVACNKEYHLNIVFSLEEAGQKDYHQFRICLTRDGISRIEEISE